MKTLLILILLGSLLCCNNRIEKHNEKIDLPEKEILTNNSYELDVNYYKIIIKESAFNSIYIMDSISGKIIKTIPNDETTNLNYSGYNNAESYMTKDKRYFIFSECNMKTCCYKDFCSMYSLYIYDLEKDIKKQISPDNFSCETFKLSKNNQISYNGYYGEIGSYGDFTSYKGSLQKLNYKIE